MQLSDRFSDLPAYAFPRLRALLDVHAPGGDVLHMTIGEPKHPFPDWLPEVIAAHAADFNSYPKNEGTPELQAALTGWIERRYGVDLPAAQVMPLNGTREGLYNAGMALCPDTVRGKRPVVLIPNPFYQVYMISAMSVGAEPVFLPATRDTGHLPDFSAVAPDILDRTALAYICSPSNPQGTIAARDYWRDLIALAERHDFQILSDECYSEIYRDEQPVGALTVAAEMGADPERVVLFNSLSKRSNVPGLRSGLVAGGPETMRRIHLLRSYSGAPVPGPVQAASARLWEDEAHVNENRALYQDKFRVADEIMAGVPGYEGPQGGFFLWLDVGHGETAALKLWQETGVRVLPGAYLSRDVGADNPGRNYIRVAMVAPKNEMATGLEKLRDCLFV